MERQNFPNLYLPNAESWVYESGGRVIGFVALPGNEVGVIFVHPTHHRKGVGKILTDKAKDLREELAVAVFVKNTIGRAFYAKYGFTPIEEKVHDQNGFDILRLTSASQWNALLSFSTIYSASHRSALRLRSFLGTKLGKILARSSNSFDPRDLVRSNEALGKAVSRGFCDVVDHR